jgi:hypothetical protein
MARATTKSVLAMTTKQLRAHLKEQKAVLSFSTLARYRKALQGASAAAPAAPAAAPAADAPAADAPAADAPADAPAETDAAGADQHKKARLVYALMKEMVETGATVKRRKAGTGAKKEITLEYKDTAINRKLGRVGTAYTKTVYADAEVEEVKRKLRRQKRVVDPANRRGGNLWIRSVVRAKEELGAPGFLIIRKTAPEGAADDLGVRVYNRARELMAEAKAAAAAPAEVPAA